MTALALFPAEFPQLTPAFGKKIQEALRREPVASNGARATHVNVPYGEHPRNVFDIWMVDSERPAPLVVFIHGGGLRRGDKSLLYDSKVLVDLLDAGISVAGINYRFSHQSPEGALGSLKDAARFLQFIRFHARTYQVDKQRIACYGGSAGGAASLWLALRDDMADPADADLIARESTKSEPTHWVSKRSCSPRRSDWPILPASI